ncbi:hypothetical protein DFJ73DRAFT_859197, partial [Zopfochytrium polystomum]
MSTAEDVVRNLDSQKRWIGMGFESFDRDPSGVRNKLDRFKATVEDNLAVLGGDGAPAVVDARAYLAAQELLYTQKDAEMKADDSIRRAQNQLRYAENSLPNNVDSARRYIDEATKIADTFSNDPSYVALPVVQNFLPGFLAKLKEVTATVDKTALSAESENMVRQTRSYLRYVETALSGSYVNAESADRYLKDALKASQPLRDDPRYLVIDDVVACLNELKLKEPEYSQKIKSAMLAAAFDTDVQPARSARQRLDQIHDVSYHGADDCRRLAANLEKHLSNLQEKYSDLEAARIEISAMHRAIERVQKLLGDDAAAQKTAEAAKLALAAAAASKQQQQAEEAARAAAAA